MKKLDFFQIKNTLKDIAEERHITFEQVAEIFKLNLEVTSNLQAADLIKRKNMLKDVKEFNNGRCLFYPKNEAYLKLNKSLHYVYVSEDLESQQYFTLDLVEMVEVIFNVDYYEALMNVICETQTHTLENDWIIKQREIYNQNYEKIRDIRDLWVLDIVLDYKALLDIAMANLRRGWDNSIYRGSQRVPYVSISNSYFALKIDMATSSGGRSLLLMEALGLIEKVEPEELVGTKLPKKFNKSIKVYTIPFLDVDKMAEIVDLAETFTCCGVTKATISRKELDMLRELGTI